MPYPIDSCRICQSPHLLPVLDLGEQKLTGVFPRTPEEPIMSGPLELVRCDIGEGGCGLLQLRHSYPLDAMYGDNYGYRSGLNQSMVRHLSETTKMLSSLAAPAPGDLIIDIGCNDGTLLKSYEAQVERIGIDPVAKKFLSFYPPEIRVFTEFFSGALWKKEISPRKAKIITSIAMFYDIEQPIEFVRSIAEALADDGIWHFEQSYMPLMLEHLAYDTICHEHIEYYALRQIRWMLDHCGLKIIRLQTSDVNGGSLAVTAAHRSSHYPEALSQIEALTNAESAAGFDGMEPFDRFKGQVLRHRDLLKEEVSRIRNHGLNLLGYGASTKGNVILQFCGFTTAEIPAIGEVNSEKYGRYTPGTNIPMISEDEMHARSPDVLLVLPWHFRRNLIEREQAFLSKGGRLFFPLPRIEYHPTPLVLS